MEIATSLASGPITTDDLTTQPLTLVPPAKPGTRITYHEIVSGAEDGELILFGNAEIHVLNAQRMGPDILWSIARIEYGYHPTDLPESRA